MRPVTVLVLLAVMVVPGAALPAEMAAPVAPAAAPEPFTTTVELSAARQSGRCRAGSSPPQG